jgi:LysR family transcriptional regulator, glycine cleavage system transcriptional activator
VLPVASPALLQRYTSETIFRQAPLIHLDWGNEGRFLPDWRSWFQARGVDEPAPQPAFSFNLTSLAIDAAVAGAGLLLGQRRLIAAELARGELVIVDDFSLPLSKPYYLAWPQRTLSQPGSEALIGWLREAGAG